MTADLRMGALLGRLRPTLARVFAAYGLSDEQAAQVLDQCALDLVAKRPRPEDPERWLLRRVLSRCHALAGEKGDEDPSA